MVKKNLALKRNLSLMSVGFMLYGVLTSIGVSFRILNHPLAQNISSLIGNLSGAVVFATMILFYLVYFGRNK